eukprot:CAMPEP_0118918778 /NCGR_PEP_ID=MMETSP1166-20130328/18134_1 /TAXON_ID=1104430 /ORGANISM="Chrysoreinhardia sp, Strain CCMP3193" /LENGTH=130 /DNA_ID=CAMNT_0006859157 /DNA_START=13 /DNA_END=405 /DNA_ORIENTATION=+
MAADDVSTWRGDIRRITREALSCAVSTKKVSKRSRIMELWAAVVSETNDAADEEQLALAKEQLYHAHLALWEMAGVTEAQRAASQLLCSVRAYRVSSAPRAAAATTRASDAGSPPVSCWFCAGHPIVLRA